MSITQNDSDYENLESSNRNGESLLIIDEGNRHENIILSYIGI